MRLQAGERRTVLHETFRGMKSIRSLSVGLKYPTISSLAFSPETRSRVGIKAKKSNSATLNKAASAL